MPRVLPFLFLLSCLVLPRHAAALDPSKSFHHYVRDSWSVQEGLPQISASAIAQTPDGYLWVATQVGLARFDGVGFTTFSPRNEPALPHPITTALVVDAAGALWIGSRGGLAVLRDGRFERVPWAGPGDEPWISRLHVGPQGRVWAATGVGVARVDDGELRPLPGPAVQVNAVVVTGDGIAWAAGADGVRRWDGREWTTTRWPGGVPPLVGDVLEVEGRLWAASVAGFHTLAATGWQPVAGTTGEGALPLRTMYRDADGNVWGGGDLGLVRVRPDGHVERIAGTRANGLFNLFAIVEDRERNLWLGSLSNGLSRAWNGWTRRYSIPEGLPDATVWALAPEIGGDGIWVATNNGLARLGRDGRFTTPAGGAAATGAIQTLFAEPGRVWLGRRNGLALYEPGKAGGARVPEWARGIHASVRGFSRDRDGHLWIGSMGGLLRWDGRTLERFDADRGLPGPLAEYRLVTLRDGRQLALLRSGLFELHGDRFEPAPENLDLPGGVQLDSLAELEDGRLLLSGVDAVLLLRHGGRWHRIDQASGLFAGAVFQIMERDGVLWISGMHGVHRLPIDQLTAFAEGRAGRVSPEMLINERGIPNGGHQDVCCNGSGPADAFMADRTLWLATRDGVLALDTDAIDYNPHPPHVHLGRMQVGERWLAVPPGDAPVLAAGERDLTLAFDVLSYQDPRSNRARYRLVGYDGEWRTATPSMREVRYTNLPPGDYRFEVMGSNNADVWSAEPARLAFAIPPFFHETLAFRLLLLGIALLLVHAGYRLQRYRYHARQAKLEALVSERTAELAESNRQLEQASLTDPLTGLRNRRYLARQVPADLDYYDRRVAGDPERDDVVVFAMLDLDHFKQVNDLHGHAAGDRVLEEAARRLQQLVRGGDYVVRWGGEEFLLVFRPMPAGQVPLLGQRLRDAISRAPFDLGQERTIGLTVSVGLSEYPLFHQDGRPLGWEAMVELADQALYHVKRHGRDGWAMFRPTASTRTDTLLADLQRDPVALLRDGSLEVLGSKTAQGAR